MGTQGGVDGPWSLRRFSESLRALKRHAGGPSFSEIKKLTDRKPSSATLSALFAGSGKNAPRWDLVSDVVTAMLAYARQNRLNLDPRVADLGEWRRNHELLVEAMEKAVADRAARQAALLTAFSVLPTDELRHPPFPTLDELTMAWEGRPEPSGGVYLPRPDFDEELSEALASESAPYPFVLVYGDDGAGKSTSAWAAVVRVLDPSTKVLVPQDRNALAALAQAADLPTITNGPTLIWVDGMTAADLDRLTGEMLERLAGTAFIVATIAADDCATIIEGPRDWMPIARAALRSTYLLHLPYEPEIIEEVMLNASLGTESFDAGEIQDPADPEMMILRLNTARSSSPAGMALVRAAIDYRRAGLERPVSDGELRRVFPHYLADVRNFAVTDELFESGIAWAQGVGSEAEAMFVVSPHLKNGDRLWSVVRTLVDGAEPKRAIPDVLWAELIDFATPGECGGIGHRAMQLGQLAYGAQAHTKAASVPDVEARAHILAGVAYRDLGDRPASQMAFMAAYRAASRDTLASEACYAAYELGNLAAAGGDTDKAVRWWTDSAERDEWSSLAAYLALGSHYALKGEKEKALAALDRDFSGEKPAMRQHVSMLLLLLRPTAESLAEVAAVADETPLETEAQREIKRELMSYVAKRLQLAETAERTEPGETTHAEVLFDRGYTALIFGAREDAATALDQCVRCGDGRYSIEAAFELGKLLHEDGDFAGAERAWMTIVEAGDEELAPRARFNIALLRQETGDSAGAIAQLEQVLADGDPDRRAHAALLSAQILEAQDADVAVVDGFYRQAIEAGSPEWSPLALIELGVSIHRQHGPTDEALSLLRVASESEHADVAPRASWILGCFLEVCEDYDGAIQAYQMAIAAGHSDFSPAAQSSLGQLYGILNQPGLSMRHLEAAYNSGHPEYRVEAAFHMGLLHYWFARYRNAVVAFREVVVNRHSKLWPIAALFLGKVLNALDDIEGAAEAWRLAAESGTEPAAADAAAALRELRMSLEEKMD
ncbi:hypothetical protein GCM10027598_19130 [Amycolatopsis oliviviridis]